jgi:DNA-binding transcriptional ArsR family regulator
MGRTVIAADPVTMARFFRVLGDPTRLRLIHALEQGERSVGELAAMTDQRQPRVSTHLACLRHCGFVESRRQGKEVLYWLTMGGLDDLLRNATDIVEPLSERLATCTRVGPDWI